MKLPIKISLNRDEEDGRWVATLDGFGFPCGYGNQAGDAVDDALANADRVTGFIKHVLADGKTTLQTRCRAVSPWDDPPINPRGRCGLPFDHDGAHSLLMPSGVVYAPDENVPLTTSECFAWWQETRPADATATLRHHVVPPLSEHERDIINQMVAEGWERAEAIEEVVASRGHG